VDLSDQPRQGAACPRVGANCGSAPSLPSAASPSARQAIIADLEEAGYLQRRRAGRRNQYVLNLDQPLRHPAEDGLNVRALVDFGLPGLSQPPNTASASVTVS
jgi:hypothetical protein